MTHMFTKFVAGMLVGMSSTLIGSARLIAADAPASAPAASAPAASAPAVSAQVAPFAKPVPRVEVFPFTAVAKQPIGQDWTGRGIQENLQSDVSHTGATLMIAPHILVPNDDPVAIAKQNHADLAVTGTYQIVGDQIRANGQLIDVATGTPVGGFSATGSQHDLFKIEDALGEQLRGLLPRPIPLAQLQQQFDQLQAAPTTVYEQPATVYTAPSAVYSSTYDTTPAPTYYYPDYSYAYPYDYGYYTGGYYGGFGYYPGYISIGIGRGYRGGNYGRDGFHDHGYVGGSRGGTAYGSGFRGNTGGVVHSSGGSFGARGGFSVGHTGGGFGGGGFAGHAGGGAGHR